MGAHGTYEGWLNGKRTKSKKRVVEFPIKCLECGMTIHEGLIYKKVEGGYLCEYCMDGMID